MKAWPWLAPGMLLPLLWPTLPGWPAMVVAVAVCAGFAALSRHTCIATPFVFLVAGACWTLLALDARLGQRLNPAQDSQVVATGWVSSLPVRRGDMLEFRFEAESIDVGHSVGLSQSPTDLLVRWYRDAPEVNAGSHWQLELRLKPTRSRVNFQGPDRERWYFSEGIAALGVVEAKQSRRLPDRNDRPLPAWRQRIRNEIQLVLDGHPALPLVTALSLADRSKIDDDDWAHFRLTGTSHLLAISGMHVGLAALTGFWLGRLLAMLTPMEFALRLGASLPWLVSLACAFAYSLLAGMGTSTRRALVMLGVLALVSLWRRNPGPWSGFLVAFVLVLLLDPAAALTAGFWFSFTAVAVLLVVFMTRQGEIRWLYAILMAQAGIGLVMAPLGMLWFQQFTLLGLVSNLIAIPWVSFTVVPPLLFALLLMPLDGCLPPFLLLAAAEALLWLMRTFEWLGSHARAGWFETAAPSLVAALLASAGGFLLLAPRGIPSRLLGLLMILPLALPARRSTDMLRLEMLDVGQGLAALVETENHLLLYDSGPGDGWSWSLVGSVIAPAVLQTDRRTPDAIVISHGDLDHAGGLHELLPRYAGSRMLANLRKNFPGLPPCRTPLGWEWDGAEFQVLHPGKGLPYLGNDNSCVLSVKLREQGVLLTGDIGSAVEQRLVALGVGEHNILLAPHHGSKTSSADEFIAAVNPDWSLVSAGYRNRFGFPAAEVSARYLARGIPVLSTADCGAIEITLSAWKEPRLRSARRERDALWRWPAEDYCP